MHDEQDITLRGKAIAQKCAKVYLEFYTSKLTCTKEKLEEVIGKEIILADRDLVENDASAMLAEAKEHDVALLVVGDPMAATTHRDLVLRAHNEGISVKIINNASIFTAVGNTGLDLYKFGKTTSIVFADGDWLPDTPYLVVEQNLSLGLHTLCLLDIKMAEPSRDDLKKEEKAESLPPRFMTIREAIQSLLDLEAKHGKNIISEDTFMVGCARLGSDSVMIRCGTAKELMAIDFGEPLHSLIVPGKLHFLEEEMLQMWTNQ